MNEQIATKKEKATASLALQIDSSKRNVKGNPPSNVEIAALLDQRLKDPRRAEVISYLANDPKFYKQWLTLVEATQEGFQQSAQQGSQQSAQQSSQRSAQKNAQQNRSSSHLDDQPVMATTPVIKRVGQWFKTNLTVSTLSGTGFAAAAALVLMINVNNEQPVDIDGLYSGYGKNWQTMPEMPLPKRGLGNLFAPEKTSQRKALEAGLAKGLENLGEKFAIENVETTKLSRVTIKDSGLEATEFNVLFDAGRLAALSHFRCQLTDSADFYQSTKEVTEKLLADLEKSGSPEAKQIAMTYRQHQTESNAVCAFSAGAIGVVSAK